MIVAAERAEDDDTVETVQELGAERPPDGLEHVAGVELAGPADEPHARSRRDRRAEVRGEDDHAVAQVHCAPAAIRQPAVVEDLEEDVPDLRVRLLELVEQEHGERLLADLGDQRRRLRLGRRVAEEPVEALGRLVLAHVEPDEPILGAEHEGAEGLRDLGLAGSGRSDEQEHAERPRGIGEPRLHERDPVDEALDRFGLSEDAGVEVRAHAVEARAAPADRARAAAGRWRR